MSQQTVQVMLAPYKETPEWYRTISAVEGNKRWFEKTRVSVVYQDENKIVLEMPKSYADTRQGISTLILRRAFDPSVASRPRHDPAEHALSELSTDRIDLQVGPAGRIVIPVAFRDAMQVKEGDRLMARVVDGELRLITPRMGVKLARKMVRELIPPGSPSLVDTLIENRRREVADEFGDG